MLQLLQLAPHELFLLFISLLNSGFVFSFSFCKLFAHILKSQTYKLWFPWSPTSSEDDQLLLMRWCLKFQIWSTRILLWKQRRWSWRTLLLSLILVTSTQQQQQLWHMRWTSQSHQLCIFLHTHFPLIYLHIVLQSLTTLETTVRLVSMIDPRRWMSTGLMDPRAEAFNSDSVLSFTSKSIPSTVQCATLLHNKFGLAQQNGFGPAFLVTY